VYGGITFYLANRTEVDEYLEDADRDFEKLRLEARKKHPLLYQKLDEARRNLQSQRK
jgi:cell division septum initiation protein DivIVA